MDLGLLRNNFTLSVKDYIEWEPKVDVIHANAIIKDDEDGTKRCKYVGNEDETQTDDTADNKYHNQIMHRSLSVEELAMEEYHFGRVKQQQSSNVNNGGWTGWHDEGRTIRTLFRILCLDSLLQTTSSNDDNHEDFTIFLSPYQSSPLDLHIGHCVIYSASTNGTMQQINIRSFYERRKKEIEHLLSLIENMDAQAIADFVYASIQTRLQQFHPIDASNDVNGDATPLTKYSTNQFKGNNSILNDIQQIRTLSMIAAGN